MTRTQWIDAIRNIKNQLSSFLSVIVIAMLAVLIYLGINYSAAELSLTTIVGILSGLLLGGILGTWIQRMMELPDTQLVRGVSAGSIVCSILITAVFAVFVNNLALRQLKTLKLSDI